MKIKTKIITADEYERDINLNILELGKEVFIQPTLYKKYTDYLTSLEDEKDTIDLLLEYEKDILSLEIRCNPKSFGISKITEGTIKAIVNTDKKIQRLKKDFQQINKEVKEAKAAVRAIEAKGNSLKNAVTMYVTGYWGELAALPTKMQEDIDAYLDNRKMKESLNTDERLLKRRSKDGKKEK